QPPKRKPPVGSSSGPPGACITPSMDTNAPTMTFLMKRLLASRVLARGCAGCDGSKVSKSSRGSGGMLAHRWDSAVTNRVPPGPRCPSPSIPSRRLPASAPEAEVENRAPPIVERHDQGQQEQEEQRRGHVEGALPEAPQDAVGHEHDTEIGECEQDKAHHGRFERSPRPGGAQAKESIERDDQRGAADQLSR